jgi:hypothetical protein
MREVWLVQQQDHPAACFMLLSECAACPRVQPLASLPHPTSPCPACLAPARAPGWLLAPLAATRRPPVPGPGRARCQLLPACPLLPAADKEHRVLEAGPGTQALLERHLDYKCKNIHVFQVCVCGRGGGQGRGLPSAPGACRPSSCSALHSQRSPRMSEGRRRGPGARPFRCTGDGGWGGGIGPWCTGWAGGMGPWCSCRRCRRLPARALGAACHWAAACGEHAAAALGESGELSVPAQTAGCVLFGLRRGAQRVQASRAPLPPSPPPSLPPAPPAPLS